MSSVGLAAGRTPSAPSALLHDSPPSLERPRRWLHGLSALVLVATLGVSSGARADAHDPWTGRDKYLHFGVSAALTLGAYGVSVPLFEERWQRSLFAAGVGVAIGAGKEVLDALGFGHPSARDFAWDLLGVAAGVGLGVLIDSLVDLDRGGAEGAVRLDAGVGPRGPSASLQVVF